MWGPRISRNESTVKKSNYDKPVNDIALKPNLGADVATMQSIQLASNDTTQGYSNVTNMSPHTDRYHC